MKVSQANFAIKFLSHGEKRVKLPPADPKNFNGFFIKKSRKFTFVYFVFQKTIKSCTTTYSGN